MCPFFVRMWICVVRFGVFRYRNAFRMHSALRICGKVLSVFFALRTCLLGGNYIAFGKSTSQRIYPEQHTPKIGWKLHKYGLKHALHTSDDHFR